MSQKLLVQPGRYLTTADIFDTELAIPKGTTITVTSNCYHGIARLILCFVSMGHSEVGVYVKEKTLEIAVAKAATELENGVLRIRGR